ncbi:MAG: hypothetical protein ACREIH_10960 [Nitrospiraceae bacterium]
MSPRSGSPEESPFLRAKLPTKGLVVSLSGYDAVTIDSNLVWTDLLDFLTEHFVPYVECDRKCTASDICPFTIKDTARPGRLKEIKCGYQKEVIRHFLRHGLARYKPRRKREMALLIEACLASKDFMFNVFNTGCTITDPAYLKWISPELPQHICYFASGLRDDGETALATLRQMEITPVEPTDLYVEGNSEKVVLDVAITKDFGRDVHIIDLGGNTKLPILRTRLQETVKRHRTAGLILDRAPVEVQKKVRSLVTDGLIDSKNIQFLGGDFEDVFEDDILFAVVQRGLSGRTREACVDTIRDTAGRRRLGFTKCLREKLLKRGVQPGHRSGGLDSQVSFIKARLAKEIARLVQESYYEFRKSLAWRKGPRTGRVRFSQFAHLCRWVLRIPGRDVRRKFLAST